MDKRFDGDATDIALLLDEKMSKMMDALAPHRGVHDMDRPRSLSHVMQYPKEIAGNVANYLDHAVVVPEEEQQVRMLKWAA